MSSRVRYLALGIVLGIAACATPRVGDSSPSPTNGPDPASVRYSCAGPPGFLPTLFDRPGAAEGEGHASAEALRKFLASGDLGLGFLPDSGWWLVGRDDREAQYVARLPDQGDSPFAYVTLQHGTDGWEFAGGGSCQPLATLHGLSNVTWTVTPDHPVGPATIEFPVLVTEMGCTSGADVAPRLLPPIITYTDDTVLVLFSAVPLGGGGLCVGIPPTAADVRLREPLGDRRLLDLGVYPHAEPDPDPFAGR